MGDRNPYDLAPNQDLTDSGKFNLVRDGNGGKGNAYTPPAGDPGMNYGNDPYPQTGTTYQPGGYPQNNWGQTGTAYPQNNWGQTGTAYPQNNWGQTGTAYSAGMYPETGFDRPDLGHPAGVYASPQPQTSAPGSGIYNSIRQMENLRKSIFSCIVFAIGIPVVAMLFGIFQPSRVASRNFSWIVVLSTLVGATIYWIGTRGKNKELKRLYKETFVTNTLREHFTDVCYAWDQGYNDMYVSNSGLVRLGNRFHSEDFLSARYRGVAFSQSDVRVQYHHSGKNSYTVTYFEGRMFTFEYGRRQSSAVQIFSKGYGYAGKPDSGSKLPGLEMEDVDFNRQFVVRAASPHDAFYILTPHFMERLKQLKKSYPSITMVINRGTLCIGLNTRVDSFDPKITRKIDYPSEKARVEEDIRVIEQLMELLNCLP